MNLSTNHTVKLSCYDDITIIMTCILLITWKHLETTCPTTNNNKAEFTLYTSCKAEFLPCAKSENTILV